MDRKICPKCKQTLLYIHTVLLKDDDIGYQVECAWCNYKSKIYNNKKEIYEQYEDAVFRL